MATSTVEKQEAVAAVPEPIDSGPRFIPLVDIVETGEAYIFYADLPGVKPADLNITYEDGALTIDGKVAPRQPAAQKYLAREYDVGSFSRSFKIATDVDPDAIKAELKDGVLKLEIPKAESAKVKKIAIKTS